MSKNVPSIASQSDAIVISIPKEEFGSFLNDLLKSKRTVSRTFDHYYDFDKDSINDIYLIIDFRIKEQNSGSLLNSEVTAVFADGSRRKYESIDLFLNSNDKMNAYSIGVNLSLSYMVQFAVDAAPLKQDIRVTINSLAREDGDEILGIIRNTHNGFVNIDIKSNSFTWADDIIAHLSNYLDSKFKRPSLFHRIMNATREVYIILFLPLFFGALVVPDYLRLTSSGIISQKAILNSVLDGNKGYDLVSLSNKINALMEYQVNTGLTAQKAVTMITIFVGMALLVFLAAGFKFFLPGRYVSINEFSKTKNAAKERGKKGILYGIILATIFSIGTGLLSSYIWDTI
ncbi:MAG: hypothetical protein E5V75_12945 [Mesorhizobium sp.]|nr:MAG: hypothetical protein E5V75_12945 [Mesorhizobium sp.]